MTVHPGDIVWSCGRGPRGAGRVRPHVVIATSESVVSVAVTASAIDPTEFRYVPLPFHPAGSVGTKFRRACWAVCDWLVEFDADDIASANGQVPEAVLFEIRRRVRLLNE